jgi:hypothetical protein
VYFYLCELLRFLLLALLYCFVEKSFRFLYEIGGNYWCDTTISELLSVAEFCTNNTSHSTFMFLV